MVSRSTVLGASDLQSGSRNLPAPSDEPQQDPARQLVYEGERQPRHGPVRHEEPDEIGATANHVEQAFRASKQVGPTVAQVQEIGPSGKASRRDSEGGASVSAALGGRRSLRASSRSRWDIVRAPRRRQPDRLKGKGRQRRCGRGAPQLLRKSAFASSSRRAIFAPSVGRSSKVSASHSLRATAKKSPP